MRSMWDRSRRVFLRLGIAGFAFLLGGQLLSGQARAALLGLDDGTYDVTLTCIVQNCGGPFTGTLTIAGSDATDWSFTFPFEAYGAPGGETFSGNPNQASDGGPNERVDGIGEDLSLLSIFLTFGSPSWQVSQGGVNLIRGGWTAAPQAVPSLVPEPATLPLMMTGLGLLGLTGWLGRRKTAAA